MSKLDIKFNIDGDFIELKDIDKVIKALTKKQRNEINQLKEDIVSIDEKKIIAKKFEVVGNIKMRESLNKLTSGTIASDSLFKQMIAIPVGIGVEECMKYLDVKITPGISNKPDRLDIQPIKVGIPSYWQSMSFTSRVSSVTDGVGTINSNHFRAGTVKLLIQDNAISSVQQFNSRVSSIVGGINNFNPGKFFINNTQINLSIGDSLNDVCNKINNAEIDVKASIVDTNEMPQFKLTLQSKKIGAENSILIDDPNGIFTQLNNNSGEYFVADPQYTTLTLEVGDKLGDIAYKINKLEKMTNLHADVLETSRGKYILMLKSLTTGINNSFKIIDKDITSNTDLILNGSNSGQVFGDIFNSTISVTTATKASINTPQDAELIINNMKMSSAVNDFDTLNNIHVLVHAPSPAPITIDIQYDINAIFMRINKLVNEYNLFRQIYLDSFSRDTQSKNLQLDKSNVITTALDNITVAFQELTALNIGLSQGMLELETTDKDDKVIKKEYPKMLILDTHQLSNILTDDPDKVRSAFDVSFNSISNNFMQPLFNKSITINHKSLGAKTLDLQLGVNTSEIKVRSYSSIVFSDTTNIVDPTGVNRKQLKTGTFWINSAPIKITNGMSLADVVSAINSVSNMSRISARNNSNYIALNQYTGNFSASDDAMKFQNINIYDPNNILQNVFSSIMQTGSFTENQLPSTGTFTINGVSIAAQSSINDLVHAINDMTNGSAVKAIAIPSGNNSYYLQFISNALQDINIDNSGGGLGNISLPTVETQQSNQYFFDTSKAVTSSLTFGGQSYGNPIVLIMNGSDLNSGGRLVPLNINQTNMKIDNLEILFIGDASDTTNISISQGLASNIISSLDEIFALYNGYAGSTTRMLQFNNQIDAKKAELENNIQRKEEVLKHKEQTLKSKFIQAQSKVDAGDAYIEMIKSMMRKND